MAQSIPCSLPHTTQDIEYTIYPRINTTRCGVFTHGPVKRRGLLGAASNDEDDDLESVLPDLSGWDYAGTINWDAKTRANIWQYQHKDGDKVRIIAVLLGDLACWM